MDKTDKSNEDWKKTLTPDQYKVLREKGTERAFCGQYWNNKNKGRYVCAGCKNELFRSGEKYDSGTGWPSFFESAGKEAVGYREDISHGMKRTEVLCARCGGHLGHIFDDGPKPTGKRYCINSAALEFKEER